VSNPITDALGPTDTALRYYSELSLRVNGACVYNPAWVATQSLIYFEFSISAAMEVASSALIGDPEAYRVTVDGNQLNYLGKTAPTATTVGSVAWQTTVIENGQGVQKQFYVYWPGSLLEDIGFDTGCSSGRGYFQSNRGTASTPTTDLLIERIADDAVMINVNITAGSGSSVESFVCQAANYTGSNWQFTVSDSEWLFDRLEGVTWMDIV